VERDPRRRARPARRPGKQEARRSRAADPTPRPRAPEDGARPRAVEGQGPHRHQTALEYFCSYIYLPRLKDRDVLLRTIQDGIGTVVSSTEFAYAESYDEQTGRYVGLRMGGGGSLVMDSRGVLLKPEVAQAQIQEEDRQRAETGDATGVLPDVTYSPAGDGDSRVAEPPAGTAVRQELPRRFYASVTLAPDRVGRDAGRIADEILSRLSVLPDAKLRVSMEIEAEIPEGAPEDVQRTVSENSQVLKFDSHGFWRT
jgi:hypothetical protein